MMLFKVLFVGLLMSRINWLGLLACLAFSLGCYTRAAADLISPVTQVRQLAAKGRSYDFNVVENSSAATNFAEWNDEISVVAFPFDFSENNYGVGMAQSQSSAIGGAQFSAFGSGYGGAGSNPGIARGEGSSFYQVKFNLTAPAKVSLTGYAGHSGDGTLVSFVRFSNVGGTLVETSLAQPTLDYVADLPAGLYEIKASAQAIAVAPN